MLDKVVVGSLRVSRQPNGNITIESVHHSEIFVVQKNDIADLISALVRTLPREIDDASK